MILKELGYTPTLRYENGRWVLLYGWSRKVLRARSEADAMDEAAAFVQHCLWMIIVD